MDLTAENIVTIRHYSMINVFTGTVYHKDGISVVVKLPRECLKATFLKDDPIVTAYNTGSDFRITGGRVKEFIKSEELLAYEEDMPDEGSKMRAYNRFPVSLYADYRVAEAHDNKKYFALVKDISEYGIMIYSKESHFKGLNLIMDIFLTREILSLTAEIVRMAEHDGFYEYGMKIKHSGPVVYNQIRNYVRKEEEELTGKYSI